MTNPLSEEFRRQLVVPPEKRVTLAFFPSQETALLVEALYVCESCQRPLFWNPEEKWWKCAECEMEMTSVEAAVLLEACDKAVKRLGGILSPPEEERKRWWHWLLWFVKPNAQNT